MPDEPYRYLFGPVRSRRMGWSLGIDLVPSKICTYDCPYCQIGRTQTHAIERREYVPIEAVLAEFRHWLARGGQADFITLAGSGEPTLHTRFGAILQAIGRQTSIRRALLSNGSLFWMPEVRRDARYADVVKGTLSAWDEPSFRAMHHPHAQVTFARLLDGLRAMRAEFPGEMWIEVFVVPGVNDDRGAMERIAELVRSIEPDRVHLNTAVRPPADGGIVPATDQALHNLASLFTPHAEVVSSAPGGAVASGHQGSAVPVQPAADRESEILAMIRRHPCTSADVAAAHQISLEEAERHLGALVQQGKLQAEGGAQGAYFSTHNG